MATADWFAVTLEEGRTYQIDLAGQRSVARTLRDPYLHGIFDADGNPVADTTNNDGGAGRASRVTFRATADAKYYVSAGASGSGNGIYRLSVTDLTDDFTAGRTRPAGSRWAVRPRAESRPRATATGSRSAWRRGGSTGSI